MIVIRNLNTIIIAGTLIISVLAFFGYNKIENIEKIVIDKTNQRLAITDSLLAKIDQKKIDSIKNILIVKEKEYSTIITNFEKTIQQNRELELLFLKSIPENESIKENNVSYSLGNPEGLFEVVINNKKLKMLFFLKKKLPSTPKNPSSFCCQRRRFLSCTTKL